MPSFSLEIRNVYDISLKAGAILGFGYKSATVLGLLDYESAAQITDVRPIHTSVYSLLGAGVPRDAKDLTYVKIRTSTGEVRVIAMDWIATQPVLVVSTNVKVLVSDIHLSDIDRLRQVLLQNGFANIDISTVI